MSAACALHCLHTLEGHSDRVWHLAWSPDGTALASCSGDRTVRIWQRSKVQEKGWRCAVVLEDTHTKSIRCCCWSPGGTHLATASFDGTVAIWAVQQGHWEEVAKLEGHESEVKGVAWSPCGNYLATCGRDKTVWFWERGLAGDCGSGGGGGAAAADFDVMDVKHGHTQDVKAVAWHPTRELAASCSYDDSIRLWVCDEGDWTCAAVLEGAAVGHCSTVWCVAFSRDGARMASCSDDCSVRVWDLAWASSADTSPRATLAAVLSGYHSRTVYSLDWSAGGLLATGDGSNAVKVFGQPALLAAQSAAAGAAAAGDTTAAAAAGNGGGHSSSAADASIPPSQQPHHQVEQQQQPADTADAAAEGAPPCQQPHSPAPWELLCAAPQAHAADVNCVAWHPSDATLLASAGDDGAIKVWRLATPQG